MKQILVFSCILCVLCSCAPMGTSISKSYNVNLFPGKYDEFLEEGEVAIRTTYTSMLSKRADGKYVVRSFLPENNKLTFIGEYKDIGLRIKDGPSTVWYAEGDIAEETMYDNGLLHGRVLQYDGDTAIISSEDRFVKGKQEGKSKRFYKGRLTLTIEYKEGLHEGYVTSYDLNGQIRVKTLYHNNKLIKSDTLVADKVDEILPTLSEFAHIEDDSIRKATSDKALLSHIYKNIKYPLKENELGITGKVVLSYVIDEFGNVQNLKALHTPTLAMAEEAKRVIRLLPKWSPGSQYGKVVRVQYTLPIKFKLK